MSTPGVRRRLRAVAAALAAALGPLSAAGAVEWQELGPAPIVNGGHTGRVSAVVCSPTDPNRYFVAGADGGVWRTTDGGGTWVPLTDELPASAIGALALDPSDENVIYAGTGEANYANHSRYGLGLYKSTDGGDTWVHLAEDVFGGRCFARIVVHPQDPQVVYAALARAGGFPELAAAKNHPGATGPVGVFRSEDGGVTWTRLGGGLPGLAATDLAMDPGNPAVLYAAIGHIFGDPANGLYKTTDGGATWTKLSGGGLPPEPWGRLSVAVAPSQPARLYILVTRPASPTGGTAGVLGACRSDNAGSTWTSLPVGAIQASYGWYLSLVTVDPGNPANVFMGGVTLHRSTSAGAAWQNVTPPHVDMHAAGWDAAGRLVIGDDGGVHRTADLGNTWVALNAGLGLVQFYAGLSTHPTSPDYLLGGTQDNGTNHRPADGLGWTQLLGGDGGWTQVHPLAPQRIFAQYQGTGNLYRSVDGGVSFAYSGTGISSADRNCFLPPYLFRPGDPSVMLYATHRIYRSTNEGQSWSALSGDLTGGDPAAIRTLAIAPSDPNVVYVATNDGRVLRSDNGGADFTLIASDVPGWPRVTRELFVDPDDALTLYQAVAAFGTAQVRRSRDGGQTWEDLVGDLPDVPVNVVAADGRGGSCPVLYAGTDQGLFRSVNDGRTWHRYGTGLPRAAVIDLRLEPDRQRLIAATQGRGAWRVAVAVPGDMNGDLRVDFDDIDPFVLALANPDAYRQLYPGRDPDLAGDLDGNGRVDFDDIDGFVERLTG